MLDIRVTRRLDNRLEKLPDDSPRAVELHALRSKALHEIFGSEDWNVISWGDTDDTAPHEDVTLLVDLLQHAVQHAPSLSHAMGHLGDVLLHVGMEVPMAIALERLVGRFRKKAEERSIAGAQISKDGTTIACNPGRETVVVINNWIPIPDKPKTGGTPSPIEVPVLVPLSKVNEVRKLVGTKPERKPKSASLTAAGPSIRRRRSAVR